MAWTVIEHKSAPASDMFDFTSLDLSAYTKVKLEVAGLDVGTDGAFVNLQLSTASTLRTSGYRHGGTSYSSSGASDNHASQSASAVAIIAGGTSSWGIGNAAGEVGAFRAEISNLSNSLYKLVVADSACIGPSGAAVRRVSGGVLEQTGTVDGIRVLMSTGTLGAGTATLYGLPTS